MNYELTKNEFIKLKKEELNYIDAIAKISSNKTLKELEKLEIYRNLNNYEVKLNEILKKLKSVLLKEKQLTRKNLKDVIIEFDLDKNYLSKVNFNHNQQKNYVLEDLGVDIETFKFKLTISDLIYNHGRNRTIVFDIMLNNQKLIEPPIYIFSGYYDSSEDCYGPCSGEIDDYLYGIYINIYGEYGNRKEIAKKDIDKFEKDKIIIPSKKYVVSDEIKKIFKEELLNIQNNTLNDCVVQTKNRVEELNYTRTPEYKEKMLLDRINKLYKKVKGEFIKKEILYSGKFLDVLRETYKLPNENIVKKEKIVKNSGKDSVIVIPITQDKEYIITFQNRIKDKIIAEFPAGYIENSEDPLKAAKRELQEEIGYITNDLFIVDEAYTSPGIDNSVTYIVIANNCIKYVEKNINGTELVSYGLFSERELNYLINNNIMNGALNKLAYYNLINNIDDCNITYIESNKKIYKKLRKKINPLDN